MKNAGREIEVNAVSTVFGRRNNANLPKNEEVIYKSNEITPEQLSLLERPNFAQYPTEQELSSKNAYFEFEGNILICRLQEGTYPAYRSVIPKNNPNKLVISRVQLLNAVKRVAVCSNQSTSHVKLSLSFNKLVISASDTNFSMSAHETLDCSYEGNEMHIGFKSNFLTEILSNLPYEEVSIELSDPTRAGLILAADETDPEEVICSLLMPIRIPS